MATLDTILRKKLEELEAKHLRRNLQETAREDGVWVVRNGKRLLSFSCNDYLGLSQHHQVKQAAIEAIDTCGAGAGASRLVTGNHPLYARLESMLASIKGTESALVFGSGYLTNIGVIPALVGKGDLILADKLVHACLIDGAQLSSATLKRFSHNSVESLEKLLKTHRKSYQNCLILTDGVFSMDGDIAPIDAMMKLAKQYDVWLLTDDAHGLGLLGGGAGSAGDAKQKPHIQMGTLSKAVGVYGGYVCASKRMVDYLKTTARSLVYSTALPPAAVAASIAALEIIEEDKPLREKPLELARLFAHELGLPEPQSSIVPMIIGEETKALAASKQLEVNGFLVSAIRPPTVPKGTARLRFTFSALHHAEDVVRLAASCKEL